MSSSVVVDYCCSSPIPPGPPLALPSSPSLAVRANLCTSSKYATAMAYPHAALPASSYESIVLFIIVSDKVQPRVLRMQISSNQAADFVQLRCDNAGGDIPPSSQFDCDGRKNNSLEWRRYSEFIFNTNRYLFKSSKC